MKKLLALLAGLALIAVAQPAQAADQTVAAQVTGQVAVGDADDPADDCFIWSDGTVSDQEPDPVANPGVAVSEEGTFSDFLEVSIQGVFGSSGGPTFAGFLGVDNIRACVVDDIAPSVGPATVPVQAHGKLTPVGFSSPPTNPGTSVEDPEAQVCLFGDVGPSTDLANPDDPDFQTTGALATASIRAEWDLHEAKFGGCNPADKGTFLASGEAELTARILVAPVGELTANSLDNQVSGPITNAV